MNKTHKNFEGTSVRGEIFDVCHYLKMEQQKYGRISVLQYIRQKKAEKANNNIFINPSYKAGD